MRPCKLCGLIHPYEPVCPYEWPIYTGEYARYDTPELQVPPVSAQVVLPRREEAKGRVVRQVRPGDGARNCPCCDGRAVQEGGVLRCSECHAVLEE